MGNGYCDDPDLPERLPIEIDGMEYGLTLVSNFREIILGQPHPRIRAIPCKDYATVCNASHFAQATHLVGPMVNCQERERSIEATVSKRQIHRGGTHDRRSI